MSNPRHLAFTLIETAAVLVLVGLMASAATLSLRSAYRGSQMKDVVSRIQSLDESARRMARLSGKPGTLVIDQAAGKIRFTHEDTESNSLLPVHLPRGYQIASFRVAGGGSDRVTYSAYGQTSTYEIAITGPNDQSQRLVFAGLTGQITGLEHDEEFDLDRLLTPRPDTD